MLVAGESTVCCGLSPRRPSVHAAPLRPCSPRAHKSQVQQSKAGTGTCPCSPAVPLRLQWAFSLLDVTRTRGWSPGHSPCAYFGVNIQQGTSDQVASCGAEDGRGVEGGWKGSRAVGDASRPAPPLRAHGWLTLRSPPPPGRSPLHLCTYTPAGARTPFYQGFVGSDIGWCQPFQGAAQTPPRAAAGVFGLFPAPRTNDPENLTYGVRVAPMRCCRLTWGHALPTPPPPSPSPEQQPRDVDGLLQGGRKAGAADKAWLGWSTGPGPRLTRVPSLAGPRRRGLGRRPAQAENSEIPPEM